MLKNKNSKIMAKYWVWKSPKLKLIVRVEALAL